jgi:serine/threonine protein phosphatase PrpC
VNDKKDAPKLRLDIAHITEIGDRVSNQDALASANVDDLSCFIVADGTGGHEGGEIAANLVITGIIEKFKQEASFSTRALESYIDWAISLVEKNQQQNEKLHNMSATMATVFIDHHNYCALWAHLGDTRIYHFRHEKILSISKDHSIAQRLVDAGYADYAQLRLHPQRSLLFAAIGAEGEIGPEVSVEPISLQQGDAFFLCTDGFWEWIQDHEMEQCLTNTQSSSEWLGKMNIVAKKNIGDLPINRDNFSAFTIRLHDVIETN